MMKKVRSGFKDSFCLLEVSSLARRKNPVAKTMKTRGRRGCWLAHRWTQPKVKWQNWNTWSNGPMLLPPPRFALAAAIDRTSGFKPAPVHSEVFYCSGISLWYRCTLTSNGIPKQVPWVNWSPYVTKGRLLTLESFDHRDYHQLNIWPIKTSKTRLVISVQYHRSTFVFSIVPTGKFLWVEPVFESAFWAGKRGLEK